MDNNAVCRTCFVCQTECARKNCAYPYGHVIFRIAVDILVS